MNHRIFERTLRSLVFRGACLFECHGIINLHHFCDGRLGLGGCVGAFASAPLKCISVNLTDRLRCDNYCAVDVKYNSVRAYNRLEERQRFDNLTSNQVGLPAELKHINKRRKRN